ncbi:hypothetical protein K503DRAFT_703739, partial [Rhizopogon vinicolor AM-OR11-026]
DGLVALMRIPLQSNLMTQGPAMWVFSGYVVCGQNFVGTWQSLGGHRPSIPTLECAFAPRRRALIIHPSLKYECKALVKSCTIRFPDALLARECSTFLAGISCSRT